MLQRESAIAPLPAGVVDPPPPPGPVVEREGSAAQEPLPERAPTPTTAGPPRRGGALRIRRLSMLDPFERHWIAFTIRCWLFGLVVAQVFSEYPNRWVLWASCVLLVIAEGVQPTPRHYGDEQPTGRHYLKG